MRPSRPFARFARPRLGPRFGRTRLLRALLLVVLALLAGAAVWALVNARLTEAARARLGEEAARIARQHLSLLDSELARYRLMPIVLGEYGDLAAALPPAPPSPAPPPGQDRPAAATSLDARLAFLAAETGAPILYVIAASGVVVAASNADRPDSFVGQDFGFRPYFKGALAAGAAEYHAAGALSGRPGLFIARRVGTAEVPHGVVVVKYEFDRLLAQWAQDQGVTLIADAEGVVLAATAPELTLHALGPLPEETRARLTASGQFPAAALTPGPLRRTGEMFRDERLGGQGEMIAAPLPVPGTDLQLIHLAPAAPVLAAAERQAAALTLGVLAGFGLLAAGADAGLTRRARRQSRRRADRLALEQAVEARTRDLRHEMAERARSEAAFRQAREDLARANRLAALGQITAGLVHEINQPVATIRTLSENARHHLTAGRMERVAASLDSTVELTERIGTITRQMRQSAARGAGPVGPVSLGEALAGARLILGSRLDQAGVVLDLSAARPGLRVMVERVPLEQVLVNLLVNAMEALAADIDPRPGPRVVALIAGEEGGSRVAENGSAENELTGNGNTESRAAGTGTVTLLVADNGPGIDPAIADHLFNPFVTARAEGLGLGLSIARDLMRRMGGDLDLAPSPLGGAGFLMRMKAA